MSHVKDDAFRKHSRFHYNARAGYSISWQAWESFTGPVLMPEEAGYSQLQPPWALLFSGAELCVLHLCSGPPGAWGYWEPGGPWEKLPVLAIICKGTFSYQKMQIFWKWLFKWRKVVWRSKQCPETYLVPEGSFPGWCSSFMLACVSGCSHNWAVLDPLCLTDKAF